jgi:hypothetical protein
MVKQVFPKSSVLFWVFLALIVAPVLVNGQLLPTLPNPAEYAYPNCVSGHSCGRACVFPWAPVGNGFVQHVEYLDNLPNDSTGKTAIVQSTASWYSVAPDQTVQYQSPVTVSYNGFPAEQYVMVNLGQCSHNGCKGMLDLLAPICSYNVADSRCKNAAPPLEMDLSIIGWVAVSDPNVMGQVTPPVLHTIAAGPDGTVIYDHYEPATWVDQGYNAWYAPVTVGAGKSCSFGVVSLVDDTKFQPTLMAELVNVDGTIIDTAALPVIMYSGFQNAAFSCDSVFPKMQNLPTTKGTNAKLIIFGGIANIAVTVYQVFGGGGMGGNVGSQAVFPYKK